MNAFTGKSLRATGWAASLAVITLAANSFASVCVPGKAPEESGFLPSGSAIGATINLYDGSTGFEGSIQATTSGIRKYPLDYSSPELLLTGSTPTDLTGMLVDTGGLYPGGLAGIAVWDSTAMFFDMNAAMFASSGRVTEDLSLDTSFVPCPGSTITSGTGMPALLTGYMNDYAVFGVTPAPGCTGRVEEVVVVAVESGNIVARSPAGLGVGIIAGEPDYDFKTNTIFFNDDTSFYGLSFVEGDAVLSPKFGTVATGGSPLGPLVFGDKVYTTSGKTVFRIDIAAGTTDWSTVVTSSTVFTDFLAYDFGWTSGVGPFAGYIVVVSASGEIAAFTDSAPGPSTTIVAKTMFDPTDTTAVSIVAPPVAHANVPGVFFTPDDRGNIYRFLVDSADPTGGLEPQAHSSRGPGISSVDTAIDISASFLSNGDTYVFTSSIGGASGPELAGYCVDEATPWADERP